MPEETVEEIQERSGQEGFSVTSTQLRRWHRESLVSTPRRQGLGQGKGTLTLYPEGTSDRVLKICRLAAEHRGLRDVAWALWWEGEDIPDSVILRQLEAKAEEFRRLFGRIATPDGLSDEIEDLLDAAAEGPIRSKPMRQIRKHVGREGFVGFIESMFALLSHQADKLTDEEFTALDHGLGFDDGRARPLIAGGQPWISGDAKTDFMAFGRLLQPERLESGVKQVGAELRIARDEAKDFLKVVIGLGRVVRTGFGPWQFGFGLFDIVLEDMASDRDDQRFFLVLWLSMRTPEFYEGMKQIISNAEQMTTTLNQLELVRELITSVPAVGDVISIEGFVQAMFDADKQEALNLQVKELRIDHGPAIDEFLAARGELPQEEDIPACDATED